MPRGSWYSQLPPFGWFDPEDRPGSAAYQVAGRSIPDSQQGIALPTQGGLGKWYNVTPPGSDRPVPLQQTDIGPDPRTGRGIDISAAGAHQMGYTPKNFPTDANFKAEPIDLTGLGLAAKWNGGVPGDNQTAVAEGPPQQGRKMPKSLMDMFQPQNAAGEPASLGDAFTSRSNSLIGLGLGLLSPSNPLRGQSGWGQALEGFQSGAQLDARTAAEGARLKHQKSQDARQAAMDKLAASHWEQQFAENQKTPYQKMQSDIAAAKGTPNEQTVADFYRNQLDAGPPQTREVFDPTLGRNVMQEWDSRSRQFKTATTGGGGTTATAPADPFTTPGAGRVYGQGGDYSSRSAPAAPGAQGQPVLPPRKPLSAHEQTAIDDAEKVIEANRSALSNLRQAKELSKNALAGWQAGNRATVGANLPDIWPGTSNQPAKDTIELQNILLGNAIGQLQATFGRAPSDAENKILRELQGSVDQPRDVREKIYDRAMEMANERMAINQRKAQEVRSGTYYNPGGGASATPAGPAAPTGTAPKAGTVSKGYVFKGGDPSKEENWAPVR